MSDGLYLENNFVAPLAGIQTTFQGNDLTQPTSLQTSYSQTFTLPDTVAIRRLLGSAEQIDSRSRWPYIPLGAMLIEKGATIFDGIAHLTSFSNGWEVELYEEKRDLFARLDRSLRTADLTRYDHPWTFEEINARDNAVEGVCYPLIDYGLLKDGLQPPDTIYPAVFVRTLVDQMLFEEGYRLVGELPTNALYKRLVLPFCQSEPTAYDEQWKADRYARIALDIPQAEDSIDKGTLGHGYFLDRIQPFGKDNIDTFYQGTTHNFNTTQYAYICDTNMSLRVQATQIFKCLTVTASVEVILSIEQNGQKVANARFDSGEYHNMLFLQNDSVSIDETIKCKAGDRIQIRLEARRRTQLGAFRIVIPNDPDNAFVSFSPEISIALGDQWRVARNVPDMTMTSLLVGLAHIFGGTWLVNKRRREVKFSSLTDTVNDTANAVDWSYHLDASVSPKWVPQIDPYGRSNQLKWKEIDETKKAAVLKGTTSLNYGDGIITVDAPVLDEGVTLFEMPFAATTDSTQSIPGYGNPVLVKTQTVSGKGDSLSISMQDTTVRILIVSLGDSFPVQSTRLKADNATTETIQVNLQPCWFGNRPDFVVSNDTRFNLCFSPLPLNKGEVCLIDTYYQGLIRVLRRMRVLTVSMQLSPVIISSLDFTKPIRLQRVRVGPLVISDSFWYLNKIESYQTGKPCSVTLIGF